MCPGKDGPEHSTSVPSSEGVAFTLRVDGKEVALLLSNMAMKTLPGPQTAEDIAE